MHNGLHLCVINFGLTVFCFLWSPLHLHGLSDTLLACLAFLTQLMFCLLLLAQRRVVQDSTKLRPELQAPLGYRSQWTVLAAGPVANPQNQQKVTCYENVSVTFC